MKLDPRLLAKTIAGAATGGLGGYWAGGHITPQLMGYEKDPGAVQASKGMDALLYAILGGILGAGKGGMLIKRGPVPLATGLAGAEIVPIGIHGVNNAIKATSQINEAAKNFKPTPGITTQIGDLLATPEAKGAQMGLAGAGLLSMLTGLSGKREPGTSVPMNVAKDFAMYSLPGATIGGLIANLTKTKQPSLGGQ